MSTKSRGFILLSLLGALGLVGLGSAAPPALASGGGSACYLQGRLCWQEGQWSGDCLVQGCCGTWWPVNCVCQDGHWECPPPIECIPDTCG
jgi:hypothetical protein